MGDILYKHMTCSSYKSKESQVEEVFNRNLFLGIITIIVEIRAIDKVWFS